MDWLDLLLSAAGRASDRHARTADKRLEAYRIIADANGEIARSLDLIRASEYRLLMRLEHLAPGETETRGTIQMAFAKLRSECEAAADMLRKCREKIGTSSGKPLDKALVGLVELQATSKRAVPWVESLVAHFDTLFDNAGSH